MKSLTIDQDNVFRSLNSFPDQCQQAWQESSTISFPENYHQVKNIIVCGMGGSRFTPITIKELCRGQLQLSYEIIDDYSLPGYATQESLVILSSFSGNTEEVLSCGQEAIKLQAKITAVTQGGKVGELLKQCSFPGYVFDSSRHNPSGQPRNASGFLLFGHLGLLHSLKLLRFAETDVKQAIKFVRLINHQDQAQSLAADLKDKQPIIITAEFLRGCGNAFANMLNENAKAISDYRFLPEINHHLLEGLKHPDSFPKKAVFVFLNSRLYSQPLQQRFSLTQKVLKKQRIGCLEITLTGSTRLSQVLEAYSLANYASFYLAQLYQVNPAKIPWVDYFKKELKACHEKRPLRR